MTVSESPPVPAPEFVESFWETRPELASIQQHARASMAPPWAVLAVVLASVAEAIPPSVVLPPLGKGQKAYGSLNVIFGLVAASGGGKGVATREAEAVFTPSAPVRDSETRQLGSGEGIAQNFIKDDAESSAAPEHQIAETSIRIDVPEVDSFGAVSDRKGSLLESELRKMWSSETLGQNNASKDTTRIVPGHMYRCTAIVGVQPKRAEQLLTRDGGGTLQRFVFLPAIDPEAPDLLPDAPPTLLWESPYPPARSSTFTLIKVSPDVKDELIQHRRQALRGTPVHANGHRNLSQLKVAALFGALNGRRDVNDEDWALARRLLLESDFAIEEMKAQISEDRRTRSKAQGMDDAARKAAEDDATVMQAVTKIEKVLSSKGQMPVGKLRGSLTKSLRDDCEAAVDYLQSIGKIHVLESGSGEKRTEYVSLTRVDTLTLSTMPPIRENSGVKAVNDAVNVPSDLSTFPTETVNVDKDVDTVDAQDALELGELGNVDTVNVSTPVPGCPICDDPNLPPWALPGWDQEKLCKPHEEERTSA